MNRNFIIGLVAGTALLATATAAATIFRVATNGADVKAERYRNVLIQAMRRGFDCHAEGRSFDDCAAEQRARWDAVNRGESVPGFGVRP